jgi:hypothetical protein
MPDLDLRDALHDLADEAVSVDLLPRVRRRMRMRHRYRIAAAGAATVLVIAGTVIAVEASSTGHDRPASPVSTATPTPRPSTQHASRSVFPTWLPQGVTLDGHRNERPQFGRRPVPGTKPIAESWYRIAGPANANTILAGGSTPENATVVHPDTTVDITFNPNVRVMPRVPTFPKYDSRRWISIDGNPALVSVPKNGFGAFRIDWVDAYGYHVVMCDRLSTPEGRSGVAMSALIRMARSLYPGDDGHR